MMRRLSGLVLVLAFAAGSLGAQGLGEVAAREKRRREEEQKKNKGPARVITTEDLANVQAQTATDRAPMLSQERGGRAASDETVASDDPNARPPKPEGGPPERGGQDEKTWRAQAAENREERAAAERKLKALEEQVSKLFGEIQRSTDTHEILRLRAQQDEIGEEIKVAKQELANLKEEQAQFEESARRAGVPPGWIR